MIFIDRDTRTVDKVAFDVHLGSGDIPIRDAGKFSPGVLGVTPLSESRWRKNPGSESDPYVQYKVGALH